MEIPGSKQKAAAITTQQDVAYAFSRNMVRTKYEDLPAPVVEITRRGILDTLGVIVAASGTGGECNVIVDLVKESRAKGKSTIIGYGGKVPSWMAGFANGAMAHQLYYDDLALGWAHPHAATVPAAFAVAEEAGGVSGKELIAAVALSVDLYLRLVSAIKKANPDEGAMGWAVPGIMGYFSAAAAAGRILGLTEDGMLEAFGYALEQAAGSFQRLITPGSVFGAIRDGFSAKGGILAALMVKRGLPGTRDSLEGRAGLFNLYFRGSYERSCLTDDLGKRFENTKVGFKPWPSTGQSHAAVEATLEILNGHHIPPEDIEEINVWLPECLRKKAESLEFRLRPQTGIDAESSVHFSLGVAATRRKIVLKDFFPEGVKDPAVLRIADRVTVKIDPTLEDNHYNATVEIKTKGGQQYSKRVDVAYGRAANPLAREDLVAKFRDCVSYSARPLSRRKVDAVIGMIDQLEQVSDVSAIIRLLY